MATTDFTTTIVVDQSAATAFSAINNVRGWWSEELEGNSSKINDVFDYHFEDIHRSRIKLIEVVPNKKVVWLVLENYFKPGIFSGGDAAHNYAAANGKPEWVDTTISFEITEKDKKTHIVFTHHGLVKSYECYDACVNGWTHYIQDSLFKLITTGKGEPNSTGNPKTSNEKELKAASK